MNVLFVGGGRRVVLARLFMERGWKVYAYETSVNVPIAHVAEEVIIGRKWKDPDIYRDMRTEVLIKKIDLVLPLMDAAIPVCAELYIGIAVVLANLPNAVCSDKRAFEKAVLAVAPEIYPCYEYGKPAIIKPISGFGSKGIVRLEGGPDETEDSVIRASQDTYIAQRLLDGPEYTVDAYFNPDGECVDAVPRLRRIVADGEVRSTITQEMPELQHWCKVIGEHIGVVGPINMQFIVEDGTPWVTECNARFGGGWPLSIAAGLDAIRLIGQDYFREHFHYISNSWTRGLATERYFEEFIYKEV